jgi:hypothetical protein
MTNTIAIAAALILLVAAGVSFTAPSPSSTADLAVVELFQSQGCSSCPPANANVGALSERPGVLALSFAVTYWDRLGWRDTFAKQEFTARQYDYSHGLGNSNVYTPQVVLNGREDLTGIDAGQLGSAVQRSHRVSTQLLSLSAGGLAVHAAPPPRVPADVWLIRYDRRTLEVPISAGENDGRTLPHKNIVRELVRLGSWNGSAESFRLPPAADANFGTAILVQAPNGGPLLAATKN